MQNRELPGIRALIRRVVAIVVVCLSAGSFGFAAPDAADAAFDAGDYPRALELYDTMLAAAPDDPHAIFRSALLLSWDNRFEEAIERYDRLLVLQPGNLRARFERAKVFSWDGRMTIAAEIFRELLAEQPDDGEIRLAYARCLSWMEELAASRAEYDRLLADDPRHVDALVGRAQTFAWAGQLRAARSGYAKALEIDPNNKDAALGMGSADLGSGRPGAARRRADELARRFPEDREVLDLWERARKATAARVRTLVERTDDTDDHRLDVFGLSARWGIGVGSLRLDAKRFEMEDRSRSATIDSLSAGIDLRPTAGQQLSLRAGVDRREETSGRTESEFLGGARYTIGLDRRWQWTVAAGRDAIRYSPTITDNGILLDEVSLDLAARAGSRWRVDGSAGLGDYSDGNERRRLGAGFSYRWPVKTLRLESGVRVRYTDFDRDLDSGYFDPSDFEATLARLLGSGEYGANRNTFRFSIDAGVQSFTANGADVSGDRVVVATGALGFPLGDTFAFELFATWGDYAAQTATGFESRTAGARLVWQGGG